MRQHFERSCKTSGSARLQASLLAFAGLVFPLTALGQMQFFSELPPTPQPSPAALNGSSSSQGSLGSGSAENPQLTLTGFPIRVLKDELGIVTSPARLRKGDLVWFLPLAGATATAFATDTYTNRHVISNDADLNAAAGTASDVVRDGFIGAPLALFAFGEIAKQDRMRNTGLLGGEAMVDAYAAGAVVKLITLRERPQVDRDRGAFFQTGAGWDSSFPSGHALVAWSSAAVIASEYSRPWQQVAVYSLATGVSVTRVLAQQHFPSDVLVGSAAGWLIGHYVYKHRHPRSH